MRHIVARHQLLRIFTSDMVKHDHRYLFQYLLDQARAQGLAGCTVLRGAEGYGRHGVMSEIAREGAGERPVVIEIIDEPERIRAFWAQVAAGLHGVFATTEALTVHVCSVEAPGVDEKRDDATREDTMGTKPLSGEHRLLRIFIGESDKVGHTPLHLELLLRARQQGLAGCTVLRGLAGFGASSVIHQSHPLRLSADLPVVVEITDTAEHIAKYLDQVSPLLQGALVTEENVNVLLHTKGTGPPTVGRAP